MPALRIKHPNGGVITHVLRSERVTIGRAPDNSIQIPHASISSHHAEIIGTDGRHRLRDLQSTNHTSVDGERITERELTPGCRIIFGSIECEYDAAAMTIVRPPEPPPLAATTPQLAQLENENFELRAHVTALQRRFDILGSARLTTGKSDHTPFAANHDAIRDLTTERDELRQQAAGLRQEIGRLRDDIAVTVRERDAARLAAAGLQTERTEMQTELQQAELRIERLRSELIIATEPAPAPPPVAPPPRPPASIPLKRPAPPAAAAREVAPIPPPAPARARAAPTRKFCRDTSARCASASRSSPPRPLIAHCSSPLAETSSACSIKPHHSARIRCAGSRVASPPCSRASRRRIALPRRARCARCGTPRNCSSACSIRA